MATMNREFFLTQYRDEVNDHIRRITERLFQLEEHPGNHDQVLEEIFRIAHTLKGSSRMMGFHDVSTLAHKMEDLLVDGSLAANLSVLFDSVIVPEGAQSIQTLLTDGDAKYHLRQAYRHLKAIGLPGNAKAMLEAASLPQDMDDAGLLMPKDTKSLMPPFITAMKQHRVWSREPKTLDFGA